MDGRRLGQALIGSLVLFFGLLVAVVLGWTHELDLALLEAAAGARPVAAELVATITTLGSLAVLAVLVAGAAGALLALRRPTAAAALILAILGSWGLSKLVKVLVARARPSIAYLMPGHEHLSGYSFPSGHAAQAVAVFGAAALLCSAHVRDARLRRFLALYVAAVALAVATSRVYLGVHYATDTAGGALLGLAWALALALAERRWHERRSNRRAPGPPAHLEVALPPHQG